MKLSVAAALALVVLTVPVAANAYDGAAPIHRQRIHSHHAYGAVQTEKIEPGSTAQIPAEPAPSFFPHIAPNLPGQRDTDGLSRNPEIATKGASAATPADRIRPAVGPAFPLEALR